MRPDLRAGHVAVQHITCRAEGHAASNGMARISHHQCCDDRHLAMSSNAASAVTETPESLLEAGVARHAAGDGPGAEALFRRALTLEPDNPTALYLLGLARFEA